MKTKCCHTRHVHVIENRNICVNPACDHYLEITSTYRDWKPVKYFLSISVFVFTLLFSFKDYSSNELSRGTEMYSNLVPESKPLNMDNLLDEIIRQEILCHETVIAQFQLESAHLTSPLFRKTNNLMGMRYPAQRKTTACGIYLPGKNKVIKGNQEELRKYTRQNNYAVYSCWEDAVADYKQWQLYNYKLAENYLEFLGRVYAQDKQYVSKLRKMTTI